MTAAPSPVDWRRAEQVALHLAGRTSAAPITIEAGRLAEMAAVAEDRVESITGLRALGPGGRPTAPNVQVIGRATWVRANIASFQRLLNPLVERWNDRLDPRSPMFSITRQIAGAEIGALLGWMSTRVLGQYDLLVNRDEADDAVYLVGSNLAGLEQRFGFDPDQFRMWVLLHELTHRAQFTGVPWMREHFMGLVEESLALANPEPAALLAALKVAMRDRAGARERVRDSGVVGLMASPDQLAVLARIGGLMSLLEGHGDVTMDRAGVGIVPDAARFGRVLRERRRRANPMTKFVQRITGLEGKMNQYAAGERFIAAIEAAAIESGGGPRIVDRCWERPEQLPTLDEIRAPEQWLARAGALAT